MKKKIKLVLIQGLHYTDYIGKNKNRHFISTEALSREQVEFFRLFPKQFLGDIPDEPSVA